MSGWCNNFAKYSLIARTTSICFRSRHEVQQEVHQFLDAAGISAIRTSYRSPWQNGVAERWVRSFRNDLLDHVIVLHETHLRRLARDYLGYYHADSHSRWIRERYAAQETALDQASR